MLRPGNPMFAPRFSAYRKSGRRSRSFSGELLSDIFLRQERTRVHPAANRTALPRNLGSRSMR